MGIFEYDEEKHLEMERNEAEERGKELGEKLGEERGENRFGQLLAELLNAGKIEDVQKIATDKEFREQLYKEYGIS